MPFHGELHLMKKYAASYVLTPAGAEHMPLVCEKIRLDKCLCLRPTRVVCRDERSKKFAPEEIKGAQRHRRRIVIQRRQKGQNLLWKRSAQQQRANWPLDVFVVGFGQRPARYIIYVHLAGRRPASTPLTMPRRRFQIGFTCVRNQSARSLGKCRSRRLVGALPVHI
jgi:hypothetical protein